MLRRLVPFALLPLSLIACALASTPWLRVFSSSVLAFPLYGAAVLSVLLPVVVVGIGVRPLWITIAVDVAGFVFFTMLVALRELNGFADLYAGIVHGPPQILSFALPLVSPRTLLVAPVALAWICGAVVGECLARGWQSVLPYATIVATFGLTYGGSARAISGTTSARREDTLLAAGLLFVILLLRAAHSWVTQEASAESPDAKAALPLRGLAVAGAVAVVIALIASALVQIDAFRGDPHKPERAAPVQPSRPVDPIAFVAGLRPDDPKTRGRQLFTMSVDRRTSNFVPIAGADRYDGDTWSLDDRTFIPSGGVIPADEDPGLRPADPVVTQIYTISSGALTESPWMPFLYRPERVVGRDVDIDPGTGMIVPNHQLSAGSRYTIESATTHATFDAVSSTSAPGTSAPASDTELTPALRSSLASVVDVLATEAKVAPPSSASWSPIAFLQGVAADLRANYRQPLGQRSGSTGYADVLASILGPSRRATPEQYATLFALIARQVGVPARLVTGFRIPLPDNQISLPAGVYSVTTADAWTWVQIPIEGIGWVAIDPTPAARAAPSTPTSSAVVSPPTGTPSTSPPQGLATATSSAKTGVLPRVKVPPKRDVTSTLVFYIVVGVIGLGVLAVLALVLRKRLRVRRRRRSGDPRLRLLGAWQESLDVLSESGLTGLDQLTSAEVAAETRKRFDDQVAQQATFIGTRANAAIFSPTSWIDAGEADAAWQALHVLRRRVHGQLTVRQRVEAGLRYHRPPRRGYEPGPRSWAEQAAARNAAARRKRPRHSAKR